MTSIAKWNAPSLTTVLSTELNSLANNAMSAASAAISNDTALDQYCDIEVSLASFSPTAGAYVAIYIAVAVDGTNYPAPTAADMRLSATQLLRSMQVGVAASSVQRVVARNVVLPPGKFKIYFDNQTNATLAASGNTVKFNIYDINLNG